MARRRYVRDNRGRFASTGATARGGRLKTAGGKKRERQTMKASSSVPGTIGKPKGLKPGTIKPKPKASSKPIAQTSKAPTNKAKTAYKAARADARMRKADLKGADIKERRMANTAAAKVKNMERRRSASVPEASADSPRSRQTAREMARRKRAVANKAQAYDRWDKGIGTDKDSRKASVAKRAQAIYEGRIDPKVKTPARLTRTRDPYVLRDRIRRGEKLTAKPQASSAARRASGRRRQLGKINEAKAGRIVERIDAQRFRKAMPGRRTANFIRTSERRSEFILKPAAAARKKGKDMSVNESVQRAVLNAAKRAKRRRR